jgi:hypothetical protein
LHSKPACTAPLFGSPLSTGWDYFRLNASYVMDRKLLIRELKSGKERETAFMPEQIAKRLAEYITATGYEHVAAWIRGNTSRTGNLHRHTPSCFLRTLFLVA